MEKIKPSNIQWRDLKNLEATRSPIRSSDEVVILSSETKKPYRTTVKKIAQGLTGSVSSAATGPVSISWSSITSAVTEDSDSINFTKTIENTKNIVAYVDGGGSAPGDVFSVVDLTVTGTFYTPDPLDLASVDGLFDPSTGYIKSKFIEGSAASSVTWGGITGTLSDQTDLQNALDGKSDTSHTHSHFTATNNPHSVTATQVGLGSVRNVAQYSQTELQTSGSASVHWGNLTNVPDTATRFAAWSEVTSKPFSTVKTSTGHFVIASGELQLPQQLHTLADVNFNSGTFEDNVIAYNSGGGAASSPGTYSVSVINLNDDPSGTPEAQIYVNGTALFEPDGTIADIFIDGGTSSTTVDWTNVTSKPATATRWPEWGEITGTLANQTDLQSALDGKSDTGHTHSHFTVTNNPHSVTASQVGLGSVRNVVTYSQTEMQTSGSAQLHWNNLTNVPSTFAPSAHTHTISNITDLVSTSPAARHVFAYDSVDSRYENRLLVEADISDLKNYALSSHSHPWSDITNRPAYTTRWPEWIEVTNKPSTFPPSAHAHSTSDITSGTFANARISESNVTQHEAALTITESQISDLRDNGGTFGGNVSVPNLLFNNGILSSSGLSGSNVDHIWHDDATNKWHFVSDGAVKGSGNSTVRAGAFEATGNITAYAA